MTRYAYWETDSDGRWRFALIAGNSESVGSSQGYSTKAGALRGIEAHRRNAARATVVQVDGAPSRAKP